VVLPIAERHEEFGRKVHDQLRGVGVRVELDDDNQTLNYRIRQAQVQKVPYMLIAGDREVENGQVSIRLRSGENLDPLSVEAAVDMIAGKIAAREEI
jgi:threonyl-tRNA synthetase